MARSPHDVPDITGSAGPGSLQHALEEIRTGHGIPGMSVGILADGREHVLCSGSRSVHGTAPVGPGTRFRAASVSKIVTACLLTRLTEPGPDGGSPPVDLDRPVAAVLPGFTLRDSVAGAAVTPRHVAAHRGGWAPNVFERRPGTELDDDALRRAVDELAGAEQISPPGRFYSYSNSGFAVLGRIAEAVTGRPFEDAARAAVLGPAGMRHTEFPVTADPPWTDGTDGHHGSPAQVVAPWARSRARSPSGGLVTTAVDLLRLARHLLDGGGPVLSPESVEAMWAPTHEAVGFAERIGIGWNTNRLTDGTRWVGHGGNTDGHVAQICIVPDRGIAVAVLANSGVYPAISDVVQDEVTRHLTGAVRHVPEPPPECDPADPGEYPGTYTDGTDDVLVLRDGNRIRLAAGGAPSGSPRTDVRFTGPDTGRAVVAGTDLLVRFLRDDAGAVRRLRVSGLVFRRRDGR